MLSGIHSSCLSKRLCEPLRGRRGIRSYALQAPSKRWSGCQAYSKSKEAAVAASFFFYRFELLPSSSG